ncbi:alpha/beta hydrolase [Paenibacillus mucilaginosus]|uniref:Putative esterase n=1 Tax=Paenibacillus mucilaginosus (strain KNP414) TaxID=1036673 RepID=F8F5X7_PAEMK|nr:alpha/beta hydrolase family protein [Paenibacillus mucilaginosus]AEI41541.1 putative esterase [Paenibacillus mucilaginosus KNP414]MCG7215422.1 esterase family protein [Paenibacillus mucilaginosus]WDM30546.1 esterase family protein [Paenibacillus mucilaginosus]
MAVQSFSFFSGALYARKVCQVYLPPSYDASEDTRYPVIYLLHGLNGDETSWLVKGGAEAQLDRLMGDGTLRESIVVMPSDGGYGHGTFYVNWYDGTGRFEDYFLYDLMPSIDREFRTIADRSSRALCGLSMGGYGAFVLALRNPELFGAAASIAGALMSTGLMTEQFLRSEVSRLVGPVHGPFARELDLHVLAARRLREEQRPELHFNCGFSDYLYPLNSAFKALLDQLNYPHDYAEYEGEHNWDYFGGHLAEALAFIERSFAGAPAGEAPAEIG